MCIGAYLGIIFSDIKIGLSIAVAASRSDLVELSRRRLGSPTGSGVACSLLVAGPSSASPSEAWIRR